jgi:hydrogenase maturation protein HypF
MLSELEKTQNWRQRLRFEIRGVVQGVGFRPFVYSAAKRFDLKGFVGNGSGGVFIEAEGEAGDLSDFQHYLSSNHPPLAHITRIDTKEIAPELSTDFYIAGSENQTDRNTLISPDVSVCEDCLRELFDKNDRRSRYPFINCTNCGTRFTITKVIPYDRPNTTMNIFTMCELCQSEYDNPSSRRFHAQPNAVRRFGSSEQTTKRFLMKMRFRQRKRLWQTVILLPSKESAVSIWLATQEIMRL